MSSKVGRRIAFWYSISFLIFLLVLAFLYNKGVFGKSFSGIPFSALAAAWSGTLGGIAISLKGVYDHWANSDNQPEGKSRWDNNLRLWHIGRPANGLIVGIAVVVLLKAAYPSGNPSLAALAAAALVLGMQEKYFFVWVKQIGSAIVAIPSKKTTVSGTASDGQTDQAAQ